MAQDHPQARLTLAQVLYNEHTRRYRYLVRINNSPQGVIAVHTGDQPGPLQLHAGNSDASAEFRLGDYTLPLADNDTEMVRGLQQLINGFRAVPFEVRIAQSVRNMQQCPLVSSARPSMACRTPQNPSSRRYQTAQPVSLSVVSAQPTEGKIVGEVIDNDGDRTADTVMVFADDGTPLQITGGDFAWYGEAQPQRCMVNPPWRTATKSATLYLQQFDQFLEPQ